MTQPTTLRPGDRVRFTPKNKMLEWAAGIRVVAGFEGDFVRLKCGNIKLLARREELLKI